MSFIFGCAILFSFSRATIRLYEGLACFGWFASSLYPFPRGGTWLAARTGITSHEYSADDSQASTITSDQLFIHSSENDKTIAPARSEMLGFCAKEPLKVAMEEDQRKRTHGQGTHIEAASKQSNSFPYCG